MAFTGCGTHFVYVLEDCYGLPQCGCETREFEEWYELEEYLDSHEDVMERIEDGYAILRERYYPHNKGNQ